MCCLFMENNLKSTVLEEERNVCLGCALEKQDKGKRGRKR